MPLLAFWTPPHVVGSVLVLAVIFIPGGYQYLLVRDKGGPMIFGQPPHEWLRLVHAHPRPWRIATISFMGMSLVTLVGLTLLAGLLRGAGDPGFAAVGLLAFAVGVVLWTVVLAVRLTLDPWAGARLAATGSMPELYTPVSRWNGALFVIFTILAFGGLLAFGGALLATSLLPHWLGWATVFYSLAGLILLALTRDSLPIMHQLMPLVMGIVLLLA